MKNLISIIITILLIIYPSSIVLGKNLNEKEIKSTIIDAGDFLLKMQKKEGNYLYEYWPFTGEKTKDDNIVRQVATMYSMATLYELTGEKKYIDSLKKTAEYWLKRSKTSLIEGKALRYFYSDLEVKLGTSALFYNGVRILYKIDKVWWDAHNTEIDQIEDFIIWMKKKEGGFAQEFYRNMSKDEKDNTKNLGFYDGEAMLAISYYDDIHNSETSKEMVYSFYKDLIDYYSKNEGEGLYLWFMTVSMKLYNKYKDRLFYDFAKNYHDDYMKIKNIPDLRMSNNCALMEGVTAYMILERNVKGLKNPRLEVLVSNEFSRLKDLQVNRNMKYEVKFNGRSESLWPKKRGYGGFITSLSRPSQRIDYQQHCISSYMYYINYLNGVSSFSM